MLTPTTGGIKFYMHTQSVAATTWTINHNFGFKPMIEVQVYDGGILKKAFPQSVRHIDDNTAEITWSTTRTGFATLASEQA